MSLETLSCSEASNIHTLVYTEVSGLVKFVAFACDDNIQYVAKIEDVKEITHRVLEYETVADIQLMRSANVESNGNGCAVKITASNQGNYLYTGIKYKKEGNCMKNLEFIGIKINDDDEKNLPSLPSQPKSTTSPSAQAPPPASASSAPSKTTTSAAQPAKTSAAVDRAPPTISQGKKKSSQQKINPKYAIALSFVFMFVCIY